MNKKILGMIAVLVLLVISIIIGLQSAYGDHSDESVADIQTQFDYPASPPDESHPTRGKRIFVEIDVPYDRLFYFKLDNNPTGGAHCDIKTRERDDGDRNDLNVEVPLGTILSPKKHLSLNDVRNVQCAGGGEGDEPCDVLHYGWGSNIKCENGGDACMLTEPNSYRPKGDLLCGTDTDIWYLCDSDFHKGTDKLFKVTAGETTYNYICTTNNEWKLNEICDNGEDDDGDGHKNCADEECYGINKNKIQAEQDKIGEHILASGLVAYYHPSCDPDKSENVCKKEELGDSSNFLTNRAVYDFKTDTDENNCCGDDNDNPDTDGIEGDGGLVVKDTLCYAKNNINLWKKASENKAKIFATNKKSFVSDGVDWWECNGVFFNRKIEGNPSIISKSKLAIDNKEFICTPRI